MSRFLLAPRQSNVHTRGITRLPLLHSHPAGGAGHMLNVPLAADMLRLSIVPTVCAAAANV
jgi:hypothetical protein